MYGIEVKTWDFDRRQYLWEFVKHLGSRKPRQFQTTKEAEDFAVSQYARVLKPNMVRVSPLA